MAKVTSSNPFDLLGEGDYDGEINPSKILPKKETPAPKQSAPAARKPQESRAPKTANRGPKSSGPSANVPDDFQGVKPSGHSKEKKAPRGRGNPRGRGRDYDRRSATGRVDSDKAVQQGWGHATENFEEIAKQDNEQKDGVSPAEEKEVDPEDSYKTLEEYYAEVKALKAEAEANAAKALRKANEGVDDSKWKDTKPLVKEEEDFYTGKSSSKTRKIKEKAAKNVLEIEQTFNVSQDRRGERRPQRGNGRGNRGSERGPKNTGSRAVSLNDESAFPSLGN